METSFLYINTTPPSAAEADPAELIEVEALLEAAHEMEPIREISDLNHVGRFVAVTGKSQGKEYKEEWPIIKAKAIERYLLPTMNVVRFNQPA